ncbi:MAG TPA: ligand-gated channel protein, partial [Myxococcaceae bacterium]|nr:ligand-gated channel protein [Myxococcaceae bacterium]
MRWFHLAGRLLCLALSTSGASLAQQAAEAPPASEAPGEEPLLVPLVEVEGTVLVEPSDSAARRDPSGALTVVPVEEFGKGARDTAALLATAPGVTLQDLGGYG